MISIYKKLLSIFSVGTIVIFIGCNKDIKNQQTSTTEKVSSLADLAIVITTNDTLIGLVGK